MRIVYYCVILTQCQPGSQTDEPPPLRFASPLHRLLAPPIINVMASTKRNRPARLVALSYRVAICIWDVFSHRRHLVGFSDTFRVVCAGNEAISRLGPRDPSGLCCGRLARRGSAEASPPGGPHPQVTTHSTFLRVFVVRVWGSGRRRISVRFFS